MATQKRKEPKPPKDPLGRFGKVYCRIWADAGFRALSHPPPNAQTLWIHLLSSPKRTSIPGVIVTSERELAEANQWSVEGLREPFRELSDMGMVKVDWTVGMLFLPNGFRYNRPENPNVVIGWRIPWEEVPECFLKLEVWQSLKEMTEPLGQRYAEEFNKWLRKPSEKGLGNHAGINSSSRSSSRSSRDSEPSGSATGVAKLPLVSEKDKGEKPEVDPVKELFDRGVLALGGTGRAEASVRGVLGKARREFGDVAVMGAITALESERPSNPIPWFLEACRVRVAPEKPRRETDDEVVEKHLRAAGYEPNGAGAAHPIPRLRKPPSTEPIGDDAA